LPLDVTHLPQNRQLMARMYYSEKAVLDLRKKYSTVDARFNELMQRFISRDYRDERAREFATHGFPRRLKTMVRCIQNVFSIISPDRSDIPTRDEVTDVTINIQSFVFNTFAATDNLAWLWVHEKKIVGRDGSALPPSAIGLRAENVEVRASLSDEMRSHLDEMSDWFTHIENFRHALAHRIPLYVPPFGVHEDNVKAYQELENAKIVAVQSGDFDRYDALDEQQQELGRFQPLMLHSYSEKSTLVKFHPQMLVDFSTIESLGHHMLDDLGRNTNA
jgi:hypothetical protein